MSESISVSFTCPTGRTDLLRQHSLFCDNLARAIDKREQRISPDEGVEGEGLSGGTASPLEKEVAVQVAAATTPAATTAVTTTVTPSTSVPGKVDLKGVPFDSAICANAKDPYYKTGPTAGQWKRAKGVDVAAYDAWYAGQLAIVPSGTVTQEPAAAIAAVDTSSAFGPSGSATTQAAEVAAAPADGGSLMIWISLKQNANLLTQNDVDQAYLTAGCDAGSLFGPTAVSSVASIYGILAAKAGA